MSLRQKNRLRTMRAVQAAAIASFETDGFESVTVEQVAVAAEVSPSTVYRHFGTKEALVLWDESDARIEAALSRELGREGPLLDLRAAFVSAYADLDREALKFELRRAALIDAVPELAAAQLLALEGDRRAIEDALVRAYRREDPLVLELVVRLAIACVLSGYEHWQRAPKRASLADSIDGAFEAAAHVGG